MTLLALLPETKYILCYLLLVALYFAFRNPDRKGKWDE